MKLILSQTGRFIGFGLLLTWLVIVIVPLVAAVLNSLKSNIDIFSNPLGLNLGDIRFGNFVEALNGPVGGRPLWEYLGNSFVATILSIVLGMTLGVLAAYGLARSDSRRIATVNRIFTFLIAVPILATLVPTFTLMGALGLRDSPVGITLVYAAFMIPPTALLMRPYFAAVPAELFEAAKLDGAGEARTFIQVILPVVFPTLFGVIVINVIWVWSELALASVLLVTSSSKTLPVGLLAFKGQYSTELGVQFAGLLLGAAPLLALYFFFSRRITEGMAGGMLK